MSRVTSMDRRGNDPDTDPVSVAQPVAELGASPVVPERRRLAWADTAKGLCILLVVLHHVLGKHYLALLPSASVGLWAPWDWFDDALKPLRMPLFFLLSGFFAASAINRPWRSVVRGRVFSLYYVYVVWLVLQGVFFTYSTTIGMNRTRGFSEFVDDLLFASTGVWYLYALVVYFVVAKCLRRVDHWVVLAPAAALSWMASYLPIEEINRTSVVQHFVYFALGAYVPRLVHRLGGLNRRHLLPALATSYALLLLVLGNVDGLRTSAMVLLLAPVALTLGVRCAVAITRIPWLGDRIAAVGRRTLPIYVLHIFVLAVLHDLALLLNLGAVAGHLPTLFLACYPILLTAAIAAICLGLHTRLLRWSLGGLFTLPSLGPTALSRTETVPPSRGPRFEVPSRTRAVAATGVAHTR